MQWVTISQNKVGTVLKTDTARVNSMNKIYMTTKQLDIVKQLYHLCIQEIVL